MKVFRAIHRMRYLILIALAAVLAMAVLDATGSSVPTQLRSALVQQIAPSARQKCGNTLGAGALFDVQDVGIEAWDMTGSQPVEMSLSGAFMTTGNFDTATCRAEVIQRNDYGTFKYWVPVDILRMRR